MNKEYRIQGMKTHGQMDQLKNGQLHCPGTDCSTLKMLLQRGYVCGVKREDRTGQEEGCCVRCASLEAAAHSVPVGKQKQTGRGEGGAHGKNQARFICVCVNSCETAESLFPFDRSA